MWFIFQTTHDDSIELYNFILGVVMLTHTQGHRREWENRKLYFLIFECDFLTVIKVSGTNTQFEMCTYNCNGINDSKKRRDIYWLSKTEKI